MNPLNTTVTSRLGRILLAVMASGLLTDQVLSVFATEKTSSPTISNSPATILVTGANRGIGLALARYFHQHGFSVIATARKPNEALELKSHRR
jgi:NADPH:quinone reductase-like Zn-dependent oxidoreductase